MHNRVLFIAMQVVYLTFEAPTMTIWQAFQHQHWGTTMFWFERDGRSNTTVVYCLFKAHLGPDGEP